MMEVSPKQLAFFCLLIFGGIVAADVLINYRSNQAFRDKFSSIDFGNFRTKLIREENMEQAPEVSEE